MPSLIVSAGQTVNTTERIESTGDPDRIQVSEECAKLIVDSGRGSWLQKRETLVTLKGKGKFTVRLNRSQQF